MASITHLQLKSTQPITNLLPFLHDGAGVTGHFAFNLSTPARSGSFRKKNHHHAGKVVRVAAGRSGSIIKAQAVAFPAVGNPVAVQAVVTAQGTVGGLLSNPLTRGFDDIQDVLGKSLLVQLISAEFDPETGLEKGRITGYAHRVDRKKDEVRYEAEFQVPADFGEIGGVALENEHHREMFIKDIVLDGLLNGSLSISCNSWIHSKFDDNQKRVFFTNKLYLPSQTPSGLRRLREVELDTVRGHGVGERKCFERVYDYDVYNDLGDPDADSDKHRPVLGGKQYPYPRRCRTGRPRCKTDPLSETRKGMFYVPRDEVFSEVKQLTFSSKTVYSVAHAVVPVLRTALIDGDLGFPHLTAIDQLFDQGIPLPPGKTPGILNAVLPRLIKAVGDTTENVLRFEPTQTMERDKLFWFRDEEFARQTLAGLNPYSIRLITEWPLKSNLDPATYGPPESAITKEMIERQIRGFMTLEEAIEQKKLFMLDYHDMFLPYVKKVRGLKGTTLYGSRTVFFLNPDETLRPVAIELTRPPIDEKPQWKEAYSPTWHASGIWLWRLAKAHVLAHDGGYHQLVSHWLRTHCCTEPYVIATNRQLSTMHPIYRLLHPHFRYTMEINALARMFLINASGIIEDSFSPQKYSMELSSVAYQLQWRFDQEALPADLISRGLAVEDSKEPHGLRLAIKDYPFANDGLLIWDALKQWVTDYVNHYYPDPQTVESDPEIQAWWTEIRTVGHGDKKDEPWWPDLKTPADLINIITTIVWVTSGHHAAVNFGQYAYAGYFPNRPTIARTPMPTETHSDEEWRFFMEKPEVLLLKCFPSQIQATTVMSILDVLSNHSPDEEYLGEKIEAAWEENAAVKAAFERFSGRLREAEGIIDERNANKKLRNRNGAGILPYELLKPFSESGVTGKGIPYSISI